MHNCDYVCRKATPQDNIALIAKYIHLTDPYIYPTITPDPTDEAWVALIAKCAAKENNIYSIEHISVVTYCGKIVGIACVIPCGSTLTFTDGITIPQTLRQSLQPVISGYFRPLLEESRSLDGNNIVNICIDKQHRGKGVGQQLLTHCIQRYGADTLHLDAVASNAAAVRLYRKAGFTICEQYAGYSGSDVLLPCYHMIRNAE